MLQDTYWDLRHLRHDARNVVHAQDVIGRAIVRQDGRTSLGASAAHARVRKVGHRLQAAKEAR